MDARKLELFHRALVDARDRQSDETDYDPNARATLGDNVILRDALTYAAELVAERLSAARAAAV